MFSETFVEIYYMKGEIELIPHLINLFEVCFILIVLIIVIDLIVLNFKCKQQLQ